MLHNRYGQAGSAGLVLHTACEHQTAPSNNIVLHSRYCCAYDHLSGQSTLLRLLRSPRGRLHVAQVMALPAAGPAAAHGQLTLLRMLRR